MFHGRKTFFLQYSISVVIAMACYILPLVSDETQTKGKTIVSKTAYRALFRTVRKFILRHCVGL
jgi:hypothetical protein